MATLAQSHAVKSLDDSSSRKRFAFKTFSQRIEDVDINVYRSLDKLKSEPSEGSSFFRDCLTEWRELNTAEDFISFYEEMIPFVQTLPLVILHKDTIVSRLLSTLQMKSRLSLEPIFRLIAAISRDLLEDFLPYLPKFAECIYSLLKSGGDREPEIVEQIFSSWSYIMMFLQKYLTDKLKFILKVTVSLRYYPKEYVQYFIAESVSFLFRNASFDQLKQGVWKIMLEVVKKPLENRKYGVSTLLCCVMKGTSLKFHSKGKRVLQLLMSDSVLGLGDKICEGSNTIIDVLILTFQELCDATESKELSLMWESLYEEINQSINDKQFMRLNYLLSLLVATAQINNGKKVTDSRAMVDVVSKILCTLIIPSGITTVEDVLAEIFDKVLQLMLCTLDVLHHCDDKPAISRCSSEWAPVFKYKTLSLLNFVGKLLQKDQSIVNDFEVNMLSAMIGLIETYTEEVVQLFHSIFEKRSIKEITFLDGLPEERLDSLRNVVRERIEEISLYCDLPSDKLHEPNLALLWGILSCAPFLLDPEEASSLLTKLIYAIERFLMVESDTISEVSKASWQSIISAALSSISKLGNGKDQSSEITANFLRLARQNRSSLKVISAVADFLDSAHGPKMEVDCSSQVYHSDLNRDKTPEALSLFDDNLRHSEKGLRVATLRLLCHYEPIICTEEDQPAQKRMKTETSQTTRSECESSNVLQLLLCIETTPLSVSTSRRMTLLISKLHMAVCAGRIAEDYVPLLLSAMIGVLYNRFSFVWDPASECLSALLSRHTAALWGKFVGYFEEILCRFQATSNQRDKTNTTGSSKSSGLEERFKLYTCPASDGTPLATVVSLLLQSLQRIPSVVDSRTRYIVPLFFKSLGYDCEKPKRVGSFCSLVCGGKEWKIILKEWVNLLTLMKNLRSSHQSQLLRDVLENRLLDANDPEVQMKVLDCLLNWSDKFLAPYDQHLKKLISFNSFRDELISWSLSRESKLIEELHRPDVIPIIIRILMPKVRKLKKHSSRKHSSVNHRKAVLAFVAQLDVDELPPFFALLIKPLEIVQEESDSTFDWLWTSSRSSVKSFQNSNFLKYFTDDKIAELSWKKRSGFLHVIDDIFGVFDELRIKPFLKFLLGCVVRILRSCCSTLEAAKKDKSLAMDEKDSAHGNTAQTINTLKQSKELRSLCLKIISNVLNKYEDYDFDDDFWELFFASVKPLVDSFKQEASSSETPSSLFACFVSMSRSPKLVSLLYREKTLVSDRENSLVSDIFAILTVSSASESIIRYVFKFIENLLTVDSEYEDEDNDARRVLLVNLETLTDSLHGFFKCESATKRKLVKCPGESERRVVKLLAKYIKDPVTARKFMDILLPLLAKGNGTQNSDVCREAVQILQGIIPVLGSEVTTTILNSISPLFVNEDRDTRALLCNLLDTVAQVDPSILVMTTIVRDLNATSKIEVGGLDYDTILDAYKNITADFFFSIREDQALLILSHCVFDMSSDELVLRQSAFRLLLLFVEFAAVLLNVTKDDSEMSLRKTTDAESWTTESIKRIVSKFLLKHLGSAMKSEDTVKRQWIILLREIVLKLPNVENLNYLKPLCDADIEIDFFNNIIHLQRHRRARALSRFRNLISTCFKAERIISKVFLPLTLNMIFEVPDGKGEHVRNACIEAISSISSQMRWDSYFSLLMRCFNEMKLNPDKQKVLLRLICSVLDQFHFSESIDSRSTTPDEIQASLQKVVLPKIRKILDSDSDRINVNISLAALKILKLLPGDVMNSQLPTIIHRISNFLKNRMESFRNEARSALAACLKELGIEYLKFIVQIMQSTLKRGFEVHVLGYSLHFILSKFLSAPFSGNLDYCVDDLLAIVANDILGDVAEEKEVEKIASKMKETRKLKSFETLKLIAQNITFKTHALKVLSPVTSQLQKPLTPKIKVKLQSMLSHIAAGIECNTSADQTDLYIFLFGLLEDGIKRQQTVSSNFIMVFALGILHKSIKTVSKNDTGVLAMLDPFVPLLGDCLNSNHDDVKSATFKCIIPLLRFPLPSIESHVEQIKRALFDIAKIPQSSEDASSFLKNSCLKLLTVLLGGTKATLSSDDMGLLIELPIFDLQSNPSFVALSLLKAIVNRKLLVTQIYDVVIDVAKLMVTGQDEKIRTKCSKILLRFLMDYQLSGKRLQQHMDFVLSNLGYEHPSGRKAALEMLHTIIIKFPKSVLDEQSQTIFLHLVARLANDQDSEVRSMTGVAIKSLARCTSASSTNAIIEFSISWYLGSQSELWGTAAQVLGLLVEVLKKGFQKHICRVLPKAKSICLSAVKDVTDKSVDDSDETDTSWKGAYYSLIMLEKILHGFSDLFFDQDLEDIWGAICELLLHPHVWLRDASNRLLALYFSAAKDSIRQNQTRNYFHTKPIKLFMIAASLCCQLRAQAPNDSASGPIAHNLVYALHGVHSLMGQLESREPNEFWSNLGHSEQSHFLESLKLLDSGKAQRMFLSLIAGEAERKEDESPVDIRRFLITVLLKRMGKIALQKEIVQMKIVFNCFGKFCSQISNEDRRLYVNIIMFPLYKVSEGFTGKVITDEMKQIAQEVSASIQKDLGMETYLEVISEIRRTVKAKRDKRKQGEKIMAAANPTQNAKRKLRIAAKHRAHKKRKIMTMKLGRF